MKHDLASHIRGIDMTWEDRQKARRLRRAQRRIMAKATEAIIDHLERLSLQTFTSHINQIEPTKH